MGGFFVVLPVSMTRTFGLKLGPQVFALNFGGVISAIINLCITKWLLPATNYFTLYAAGGGFTFIGLLILCFLKEGLDIENLKRHDALIVEQRKPLVKHLPSLETESE